MGDKLCPDINCCATIQLTLTTQLAPHSTGLKTQSLRNTALPSDTSYKKDFQTRLTTLLVNWLQIQGFPQPWEFTSMTQNSGDCHAYEYSIVLKNTNEDQVNKEILMCSPTRRALGMFFVVSLQRHDWIICHMKNSTFSPPPLPRIRNSSKS